MKLNTIKLHSCGNPVSGQTQITLDDDYNVPDYRPDIVKIIKEHGTLQFEEVKVTSGAAFIKGCLQFAVLYRSDQENGKISCLKGEIPFQEKINCNGLTDYDLVQPSGEVEDLTIGVIHPRKISVRAVLFLKASVWKEKEEELCTGFESDTQCEQRYRQIPVLQLLYRKNDVCRQKSEFVLPSSKPNVQEILWKSLELRNVDTRIEQEKLRVTGEVLAAVLYQEEDETDRIQWYETVLPLECSVDCYDKDAENLIYKIRTKPSSMELEVKPDYDGEERMFVMELAINLEIRVWQEQKVEVLEDVYSLQKELLPERKNVMLGHILVKNDCQCRMTEQMELSGIPEKVLQICACEGKVHVEKKELTAQGLYAEGVLCVELLYVTTDDKMPVGSRKAIYPFEQLIEIMDAENKRDKIMTELECEIGQMSAVMLDQEHVEIKAVLNLKLLAFEMEQIENITEIKEELPDLEQLKKQPGLTGYIVKNGDSLWQIAKENHTTVESILKENQKTEDTLTRGEKLLIVKKISM